MSPTFHTSADGEEVTRTLVPKLRFPEFRDEEGWNNEILEDLLAIPATYGIVTAGEFQQEGIPMLRGGDIKDGCVGDGLPLVSSEIHSQYRRTILQADDVVIALVGYPGEAAVIPSRYVGANISRAVGLLRLKDVQGSSFLACYLNSPMGRQTVLKPSAGSAQVVVNLKHLNALLIPVPSPVEQQKIAECLSSVDELLAAQARKVDELKTHKKGLMQQLFPREGETQPRLRFPEFQNAGEWSGLPLGDLGEIITGKTPSTKEADLWGGDILFITPTDISEEDKYQRTTARTVIETKSTKILPAGSIVYTCIASIGKMALTVHPSITNQQINAVVPNEKTLEEFIYYALVNLTPWIKTLPATNTLPIINKSDFSKIAILFPEDKAEQHRIASCLSSLDALITAETQKHDALKTHKRGLMQQLFPSPEEATS
jgi:type I restriction enzyme S subunit